MLSERKKNIHTTEEERRKSEMKMIQKNRFSEDLLIYKIEYKIKNSCMKPKIPNRIA
jgi:hypothetical protein